jgi:hypothetical protein
VHGLVALDDLVDALVAEIECLGDLTHRSAGGVKPTYRMVIVDPRAVGFVLEVQEAGTEVARLRQRFLV